MDFHKGDSVVHWVYGLGKVIRVEKKDLLGISSQFYVVQLKDLTVWVPADGELLNRLRHPTPKEKLQQLFDILSGQGEVLPSDRLERKAHLQGEIKKGSAEANCRIVRDLSFQQQASRLNDHDTSILKQAQDSILGEWTYSLSVPRADAEQEMHRLLTK